MRLSGTTLPLEHISASSLSKAIQCPELWRRRYLLKEEEKLYSGRFMGIVDHRTHEENFSQKIETGEDLDVGWIRGRYKSNWDETITNVGEPDWKENTPEEMYRRGLLMVEAYHSFVSPSVMPVKVEQRFEEVIRGVPFPLVGYPDVETATRIIERKTSNKKVSSPKPEWRFQARVYQLVCDLPTEWHVVTSQESPRVYTEENAPELFLGKGDPDAIVSLIRQTVERLEDLYVRYGADRPWPTEGLFHPFLCSFCGFRDSGCPAWIVGN